MNKTFQTVWIANTTPTGATNTVIGSPSVTTPRGALICGKDTAIWMPGYEMTDAQLFAVLDQIIAGIPVGRLGMADEIARCVAFLAAEDAGFITGATLSVNGGQYIS